MAHRGGAVLGDITNNVAARNGYNCYPHAKVAGGRKGSDVKSKNVQGRREPVKGTARARELWVPKEESLAAVPPATAVPVPMSTAAGATSSARSCSARATCGTAVVAMSGGASSSRATAAASAPSACSSMVFEDVEMEVVDPEELEDPQFVAEYASDIYRHLDSQELEFMPRPDYMDSQQEINAKMRGILMDWLVEVQIKYRLKKETLFLAVSIVDRYLSVRLVARAKLQLVGIAGMLIASKFEEIYPPETKEYVYIADNAYTKEDLLAMEVDVLATLGFDLCCPTPAHYFDRYSRANKCSQAHGHLLQYLLELTLVDYKMLRFTPSHLTAAATYLSNKLMKQHPSWPPAMVRQTQQTETQLWECARELCRLVEAAKHTNLQAVRRKFSRANYSRVAEMEMC